MVRMSHASMEPSVVDEEMLQRAVEEQGPQGQAGQIAKEEGIQYQEVRQLRLDYRNILKIDHLWQFTALTKLQLDNNIIEKIEGLEHLTNLVWLDLSFNNIEKIEGLDQLVKLEDLSLYNNRISVIQNMDSLLNLQVLSLGNNFISELSNIVYLRVFKNLRSLNLSENPICDNENYKIFTSAYLQDLVYLDFRLVDEKTRMAGLETYDYNLQEIRHSEALAAKALQDKRSEEEELRVHRDAFVEFLNGPYLFESMYAEDTDATKLAYLPGVGQLLGSYQNQLVALCMQVFELGLAEKPKRGAELGSFYSCYHEAVTDNGQKAIQTVSDFESSNREIVKKLQQSTDPKLLESQLNQANEDLNQLCDTLMTLEMHLVDQLEDIMKEFERNMLDMVAGFIETVQGIFAQCRELENHHHERLQEIAAAALERVAKGELEEEMPDEVHVLFVDKDTLLNAVNASHDIHLLKIDNREDELLTRIKNWVTALTKSIQDDEVKRNRKRTAEIHNYVDYVKAQLNETARLKLQEND